KSRPEIFSLRAHAEPVDTENLRRILEPFSDSQPMSEVITHVVATEREHRHRVPPHNTDCTGGGCRCLRRHSCAEEDPMLPIERLVDERNQARAATTKENCGDGDTGGIFPFR